MFEPKKNFTSGIPFTSYYTTTTTTFAKEMIETYVINLSKTVRRLKIYGTTVICLLKILRKPSFCIYINWPLFSYKKKIQETASTRLQPPPPPPVVDGIFSSDLSMYRRAALFGTEYKMFGLSFIINYRSLQQ